MSDVANGGSKILRIVESFIVVLLFTRARKIEICMIFADFQSSEPGTILLIKKYFTSETLNCN